MSNWFAEQVAKKRKDSFLTQEELGELCGVSRWAIGYYENGTHHPELDTAVKIAKILGINLMSMPVELKSELGE